MKKLHVFIIAVVVVFTSCKKENNVPSSSVTAPKIEQLKNWYQSHKSVPSRFFSRDSTEGFFDEQTPVWDSTLFYAGENVYATPLKTEENPDPKTAQSLVLHTDAEGNIVSGEYTFIRLGDSPNNISKEELLNLYPRVFDLQNLPANFDGSILKYDLNGDVISSKHMEGQVESVTNEKLLTYARVIPEAGLEYCVDHWWVIYEGGIIISITYLGSDCYCYNCNPTGGGSGGGGTGGGNASCYLNAASAQAAASTMSGTNSFQHSLSTNHQIGIVYKWDFYELHYYGNYSTKWTAYFPGTRKFENGSWKWLTISFGGVAQTSGTPPPCFGTTCSASSFPTIKADGNARATLNYTFTTSVYLFLGGIVLIPPTSSSITDDTIEPIG